MTKEQLYAERDKENPIKEFIGVVQCWHNPKFSHDGVYYLITPFGTKFDLPKTLIKDGVETPMSEFTDKRVRIKGRHVIKSVGAKIYHKILLIGIVERRGV